LPDAGMSFEIPRMTAVPLVEEVAEEGAVPEQGMTNNYLSIPVKNSLAVRNFLWNCLIEVRLYFLTFWFLKWKNLT
jgi:hypothetical protein